jgi:hypothetical protein
MADRALLNGEVVRPFDIEKPVSGQLKCVPKEHEMHLVEEYETDKGFFTPRHFSHNPNGNRTNCTASGGESDIHEHRKEVALSKALVEFDCSEWGIEKKIGGRIADAYIKFTDGHPRYGVGIAIEYQHENKGKDKEATTENYAKENYSTVWLWREQFSENDSDVNLFGGKVCPIWPTVVPKHKTWRDRGYFEIKKKWVEAWNMGLSKSGAPATLPSEWCDEKAQEIWKTTPWNQIIERGCVNQPVHNGAKWESERYIENSQAELGEPEVNAILPNEWYDEQAQEIWRDQDWKELFDESDDYTPLWDFSEVEAKFPIHWFVETRKEKWRSSEWQKRFSEPMPDYTPEGNNNTLSLTRKIPFTDWLTSGDNTSYHKELKAAHQSGKLDAGVKETHQCPHCGNVESHTPRHEGEIQRGTSCGVCGDWYTVHERAG